MENSRGQAQTRRGAFTLVELLIAVALLVILGGMAIGTLRYGTDLWRAGHARSYCYDTATIVFQQLGQDLNLAMSEFWNKDTDAYDERIKFWVDWDTSVVRSPEQRLRFVCKIPNNSGSDATSEGMRETAYMMGTGASRQDSQTLYRATAVPIGDANSLFRSGPPDPLADPFQVGMALTDDVVLYFEVRLWSQYTTTWDAAAPYTPWVNSWTPEYCGPRFGWVSDELADVISHVFPRAVMAVVVVEPREEMRGSRRLTLAQGITAAATTVLVSGALPAYSAAWPYLRIDKEWIRFTSFDAATQSFVLDASDPLGSRGVRNTAAAAHSAGAEVKIGYTFSTVFYNPSGREYWGVTP